MADMTGIIVVGALVLGGFLFKDQIIAMLPQPAPETPAAGADASGGDQTQQQPTSTSTTNIYAPTPLGIGLPVYPLGYAPYGGYPWQFPPVIGHFSAPRWFNNWPRYPYPYTRPGPWGGPRPPHFLGPPVPAPMPGPHH